MWMRFEPCERRLGVPGESIEVFDYDKHIPTLDKNSQQGIDERFRWFFPGLPELRLPRVS